MNEWYSQWTPLLNKIHVLNINMILITWNEYPNQPNSDHRICIFSFHIEFNTREEEEEEIISDIILFSCLTKERKWTKMFLIITTNLLVGRYTYWIVYLFFFLLITAVSVLKCIQIDKNERINRRTITFHRIKHDDVQVINISYGLMKISSLQSQRQQS
jgi:hypothetical protein